MSNASPSSSLPAYGNTCYCGGHGSRGCKRGSSCHQCHEPEISTGRNLVVCIDGTSNKFSSDLKLSNVIKLYRLAEKSDKQLTYYNSGIGTYARPETFSPRNLLLPVYHKIEQAFGLHLEPIVNDAYRWISDNYQDSDRIFLFGFSRGAYQVRLLSAMIDRVGLIHRGNTKQIPFAYELYTSLKDTLNETVKDTLKSKLPGLRSFLPCGSDNSSHEKSLRGNDGNTAHEAPESQDGTVSSNKDDGLTSQNITESLQKLPHNRKQQSGTSCKDNDKDEKEKEEAEHVFKHAFCRKVNVHFVGAWDTVSSIGFARGGSHPDTTSGMSHVCYFRHALALDERRVKFLPEYVCGGASQSIQSGCADEQVYPHTKEVWFPGTHSDIGGLTDKDEENNRLSPPLAWMYMEAGLMGLRFNEDKYHRQLKLSKDSTVTESLTPLWLPVECLPLTRLSYGSDEAAKTRTKNRPHFGRGRKVLPGQLIHVSVWEKGSKSGCAYIPKARFHDRNYKWTPIEQDSNRSEPIVEPWGPIGLVHDYYHAKDEDKPALLQTIKTVASTDIGKRGLQQAQVFNALKNLPVDKDLHPEDLDAIHAIFDIVYDGFIPETLNYKDVQPRLSHILSNKLHPSFKAARRLLTDFTDLPPVKIGVFTHPSPVVFASFWGEKFDHVIAASEDGRIRVWNVRSRTKAISLVQPEHISLFTSSSNSKHAVSVSRDNTIYLWGPSRHQDKPLWNGRIPRGSAGPVNFIAKDELVVTAMDGHKLLIWNIKLSDEDPGKDMESRFKDDTPSKEHNLGKDRLHLLDASHLHLLSSANHQPWSLLAPKDVKGAVAFSDSLAAVITASGIDVYNRQNEVLLSPAMPLSAGKSLIMALAFSNDGNHLIAGGEDGCIHIWDTDRWHEKIVLPAHDSHINGIVVSDDDRRIVSYSEDHTVRVWDAEILLQGPHFHTPRDADTTTLSTPVSGTEISAPQL